MANPPFTLGWGKWEGANYECFCHIIFALSQNELRILKLIDIGHITFRFATDTNINKWKLSYPKLYFCQKARAVGLQYHLSIGLVQL